MKTLNETLFYDLHFVREPAAMTDVRSARGAVSWRLRVPVERLVHEEPIPTDFRERPPDQRDGYGARVVQFLRGAAWERFLDYLSRVAVNTGIEWLAINLEPGEHVFLFSTRAYQELGDRLGWEAGTLETDGCVFHIRTDRRIAEDACYCLRSQNHRIFARYEIGWNAIRAYLSGVIRVGGGRSIVSVGANDAMRYLRTVRRGPVAALWDAAPEFPPSSDVRAVSVSGFAPILTTLDGGRPSHPASVQPIGTPRPEEPPADRVPAVDPFDRGACPRCAGDLFFLAKREAVCFSCGWDNLPLLRRIVPPA